MHDSILKRLNRRKQRLIRARDRLFDAVEHWSVEYAGRKGGQYHDSARDLESRIDEASKMIQAAADAGSARRSGTDEVRTALWKATADDYRVQWDD